MSLLNRSRLFTTKKRKVGLCTCEKGNVIMITEPKKKEGSDSPITEKVTFTCSSCKNSVSFTRKVLKS